METTELRLDAEPLCLATSVYCRIFSGNTDIYWLIIPRSGKVLRNIACATFLLDKLITCLCKRCPPRWSVVCDYLYSLHVSFACCYLIAPSQSSQQIIPRCLIRGTLLLCQFHIPGSGPLPLDSTDLHPGRTCAYTPRYLYNAIGQSLPDPGSPQLSAESLIGGQLLWATCIKEEIANSTRSCLWFTHSTCLLYKHKKGGDFSLTC